MQNEIEAIRSNRESSSSDEPMDMSGENMNNYVNDNMQVDALTMPILQGDLVNTMGGQDNNVVIIAEQGRSGGAVSQRGRVYYVEDGQQPSTSR